MALTNYYVDPGGGSDVTGDGSIDTPWASVQHALDTITRNSTDGDQINIKAGTADVLAAPLSLATYGTPTTHVPLVIRGYSNAAGDGGFGQITAGGDFHCTDGTFTNTFFINLDVTSVAGRYALSSTGERNHAIACKVSGAGKGITLAGAGSSVVGCWVETAQAMGISVGGGSALYNYVREPSLNAWSAYQEWNAIAVQLTGTAAGAAIGNICVLNNNNVDMARGIVLVEGRGSTVMHNAVVNLAAGRGAGIEMRCSYGSNLSHVLVANNIVCGFSGVGGKGVAVSGSNPNIVRLMAGNALYNCATPYSYNALPPVLAFGDITLAADPFTDAANGDFSLTAAAKTALAAKGWPTGYLGAHANTVPNLNIGPIQMAAGGSSIYRRVMRVLGG